VRAPDNLKIAMLAGGLGTPLAEETERTEVLQLLANCRSKLAAGAAS
jgi:hypothetical protein